MKNDKQKEYDLCVIGGGINGTAVARDAAGRGLSVVLLEAKDLAGATSSATSKMLHGGLRYLEYYEFKMVKEALKEREIIMNVAPHISQPMDLILPDMPGQRPAVVVRVGLKFYDFLAGSKKLKKSKRIHLDDDKYGFALKDRLKKGFRYSDGVTDDARLVIANAQSAAENGADILTHSECKGLQVENGVWQVSYGDEQGRDHVLTARNVVNAAGPWVSKVLDKVGLGHTTTKNVRMVKGSHIVVARQYDGDHSYLLQQANKRVTFVWPFKQKYTLIGTTEEDYRGDPRDAEISADEQAYLLQTYNDVFKDQIEEQDILWRFSGVRPLMDDGTKSAGAVTRGFEIYEHKNQEAPLYSIYGGKLTTYRKVAKSVVDRIAGDKDNWTQDAVLPGGDIGAQTLQDFIRKKQKHYDWMPHDLTDRYGRTYGSCMDDFLKAATSMQDLGKNYGADLYHVELEYLFRKEFARSAEDVLWRRTKLGLEIKNPGDIKRIEAALMEMRS